MGPPTIDHTWQHCYETVSPESNGFTHYTLRPLPYERIVKGWHFTVTGLMVDESIPAQAQVELVVNNRIMARQPLRELLIPDGLELFMREVRGRLAWLEDEVKAQRFALTGAELHDEAPRPSVYPGELEVPLYIRRGDELVICIERVPEHLRINAVLRGVIKPPPV